MTRVTMSLLAPPLAVCRYGRASCCAAPIGVFWVAGIVSLIYGGLGGPLGKESTAWSVVALGILLWAVATVWALLTLQGVDDQQTNGRRQGICRTVPGTTVRTDEPDPLKEVQRSKTPD